MAEFFSEQEESRGKTPTHRDYFGNSTNAVMTQIWIAAAVYLMMATLHKQLWTLSEARMVIKDFRIQ
jgi:hypothetical protein